MDVYLRVGLAVLAVAVFFLLGFEIWYYRQQRKFAGSVNPYNAQMVTDANSEEMLAAYGEQLQLDFESASASLARSPMKVQVPVAQSVPSSKSQSSVTVSQTQVKVSRTIAKPMDDLLQISVVAKQGRRFASYELLQAISATGMQFGDMNIFHYYSPTQPIKTPLFSLASLTKPGYFDLDQMGNFSCAGLTLFTQLRDVEDPQQAFELMLKAADQLVDDLDGELRSDPRTLWNNEALLKYQEKVLYFQLTDHA